MAKVNPIKLKQDADKLEKAGKLDQAIALYRQIVDDNPHDWNTVNKIGDLYAKLNRPREAGGEYSKVAEFYAKDGFLLKAIAIWKKINKLDASALEPYLHLAELYAKQGLMMEAKSQYQIAADEYVKRGKMRDAGEVLRKMAEIDPGDLKIRSKLADLYMRDGNAAKAVDEHIAIAEELNKKGHLAEALQVLDKGLKIDPKSVRLRSELARVHLVQKNYDRAIHYLEEAVQSAPSDAALLAKLGEAYVGGKKIEEAEAIFKRLLEITPDDLDSRIQMGRVRLGQGQFDAAYEQFVPASDQLLAKREGEKAAQLFQQIVQADVTHVKSLVKLVDLYRQLKKDTAVLATYSQLTEAYIQQDDLTQAVAVLELLVSQEPQNQQHKTKLEFVRNKLKGAPTKAPAPKPAPTAPAPFAGVDTLDEEFDFAMPEAASTPPVSAPPVRGTGVRAPIEVSGPLSEEDSEFIEEHLAEGKVFRKYGLVDKAADQFESVIARFPDNVEARQELRELYEEKGLPTKAAEQALALAEIFRLQGNSKAAAEHEAIATRLSPSAAAAKATLRPSAAPTKIAPAPAEEEIVIDEGEDLHLETQDEDEIDLGIEEVEEKEDVAGEVGEELTLDLEDSGAEIQSPFLDEEAPAAESPSLELEMEEAVFAEAMPAPLKAPSADRSSSSTDGTPSDLHKALEEVQSYISLGFVDDAKEALREMLAKYPAHPAILSTMQALGIEGEETDGISDSLSDLDLEPAIEEPLPIEAEVGEPGLGALDEMESDWVSAAGPTATEPVVKMEMEMEEALLDEASIFSEATSAAAAANLGSVDMGTDLGELFGAQSAVEAPPAEDAATDLGDAGLADIFKEFKKGVDKQLGKEDYDTRYNLGIAYKEMGLLDEAIAEFQLAAKDENRILECSSMLGICFMEKGMAKLAVKWFEKGLKVAGRSEEEYNGLRYDLATAYEAGGEVDRALSIYTELYGQDANFRDVSTKVRELKG